MWAGLAGTRTQLELFTSSFRHKIHAEATRRCGKLTCTIYGKLDAAQRWADHYTEIVIAAQFLKCIASACHFHHPTRKKYGLLHGDDLAFVADDEELEWCMELLESHYTCNIVLVGLDGSTVRKARILARIIRYEPFRI